MSPDELNGAVIIRLHTQHPCGDEHVRGRRTTIARGWGVTFEEARTFVQEWKRLNPSLADQVEARFQADEPIFG